MIPQVAQFPPIVPLQVVVSAAYPGTSRQIVANTVNIPLEQQLNGSSRNKREI
jgi:multidrug efflux pump